MSSSLPHGFIFHSNEKCNLLCCCGKRGDHKIIQTCPCCKERTCVDCSNICCNCNIKYCKQCVFTKANNKNRVEEIKKGTFYKTLWIETIKEGEPVVCGLCLGDKDYIYDDDYYSDSE